MARFIIILNRLINLYLYFVIMACFLGCVPNINPNYPLFNYIFKLAGFYLVPPVLGLNFSPAFVMVCAALLSVGLQKLYNKYFESKKPEVIVISAEDFFKKAEEFSQKTENTEYPKRKDDENE